MEYSLFPTTEGLNFGVGGFQSNLLSLDSTRYTNETLASYTSKAGDYVLGFAWGQQPVNPFVCDVQESLREGTGTIAIRRQTPTPDLSIPTTHIQYWVKLKEDDNTVTWKKVEGDVVAYTFNLEISLQPTTYDVWLEGTATSMPFLRYQGIWFNLGTVVWNRAVYDPNDPSKTADAAYSIPLSVYIEDVDKYGGVGWYVNDVNTRSKPPSSWVEECIQLSDVLGGGDYWTLYTNPKEPASLNDIWYKTTDYSSLNATLASTNTLYPDTGFQSNAWCRIGFNMFRPAHELNLYPSTLKARWFPCLAIKVRVYYLSLGEFTYVQQKSELPPWTWTGWLQVFTPIGQFWNDFFGALGMLNPFNVFGAYAGFVGFLFLLLVIGIIIIALLAIFAPWALKRLTGGLGAAKTSWEKARRPPSE
jgi:hypothetical protein